MSTTNIRRMPIFGSLEYAPVEEIFQVGHFVIMFLLFFKQSLQCRS